MTHELETAAAASAGGWVGFKRKAAHAAPLGSPCANCGEALQGPWCHACGQLGEDFHRSTRHLIGETFESLFHFDGRFWRTLPDLLFRPGKLTRDYLDGHRVPQIPPLRLFLVALLLVFLAGSIGAPKTLTLEAQGKSAREAMAPADRAELNRELAQAKLDPTDPRDKAKAVWLKTRLSAAINNPERFLGVIERWSERFAFALLPMSTLLLSLVFVFQRRFYVFDHAIFSLHSLSALGLLLTAVFLLDSVTAGVANWLLLLAPIHLFAHMRGVYRTSASGTLIRMLLVFMGSLIGLTLLIIGLISVGLSEMGG